MLRNEKEEGLISMNPFEAYPELEKWLDEDGLLAVQPGMIPRDLGLEYGHHLLLYDDGLESIIMNGCLSSCMQEATHRRRNSRSPF